MRTTILSILAAATLFSGVPATAGYRELSGEFDGYRPPSLYRSGTSPAPAGSPGGGAPGEFEAQVARLRELQAGWEKALSEPAAGDAFLVPDPARVDRLRNAADNVAAAEGALADGHSLEDLEALALLRNADVAAKEREARAALEGYAQVENLDTILRRYSAFNAGLMTGIGPMESPEAMAASTFPFPGVLALKGQAVTQDVKAARENLEAARRRAVTAVRKAYWEILYVEEARKVTAFMLDLLEQLKSAASARYASGMSTYQDVLKVGIEREMAREELRTLDEERRNAEAMIREALSLPPSARVGLPAAREPQDGPSSPDRLQEEALARRQELRAMRAMIGKMERMLEMQETMIHPGYSLNFSRMERDEVSRVGSAGMDGETTRFPTTTAPSVGEGLPKTPFLGVQDAYVRELRQRIEALRDDLRMEEARTVLEVRNAWFRMDKAGRERALYADRVGELSRAALETSGRGYSAGKVMFADVIMSYRGWLESNLSRARSLSDLGTARAELEDVVGAGLPQAAGGTEPGAAGRGTTQER